MDLSKVPVDFVRKSAIAIGIGAYSIASIGVVASYGTQVVLLLAYGVGMFSYVLPATVDILAVCAALALQLPFLDKTTRWVAGIILTLTVGVSVTANVIGAHNPISRAAHAWPVIAYLLGELLAGRVRAFAARLAASQADAQHSVPQPPAAAPVSPGQPPAELDPPEVLAFREAQAELRRTSKLPALNGSKA